jgi:large subunit ribosomal protein L23
MKGPHEIVLQPLLTEKGTRLKEEANQYLFRVAPRANKIEIKRAVELKYSVTVLDVNTLSVRGKVKRMGRFSGKRADWKKAIVTLKAGDHIELAQNV